MIRVAYRRKNYQDRQQDEYKYVRYNFSCTFCIMIEKIWLGGVKTRKYSRV